MKKKEEIFKDVVFGFRVFGTILKNSLLHPLTLVNIKIDTKNRQIEVEQIKTKKEKI